MGKMSEVVKGIKTGSPERFYIQNAINAGKDPCSNEVKRYFFQRPPYQYTSLEPKSWGTQTKGEET